jgi:hypothetical protein
MQLVSETGTNPRINRPKAATMSRLYSITRLGLLVGGAIDPMKGECECINRAYAKQAFCNRCVGLGHLPAVCGRLSAFINEVRAHSGHRIAIADELIDLASQIRAILFFAT